MNNWLISNTKPNRERAVAVQLHQRGLQVFLPLVWVNPVNPRAARERPYFPAYLFAQIDESRDCLDIIRWAPGIKQVIECDGEVLSVADSFVAELRERLAQIRAIPVTMPGERPRGTAPLIGDGPFAGFDGIFDLRLGAAVRSQILLACAQQEHWRLKAAAAAHHAKKKYWRSD